MVDVRDIDRDPLGRNATREAFADRDPDSLLDLLLDPLGSARHELLILLVQQEDRHRVD